MGNTELNILRKPMLLREATSNQYEGEGMEIATYTSWEDSSLEDIRVTLSEKSSNRNADDLSCKIVENCLDDVTYDIKNIRSEDDTVATFESDETDLHQEECHSMISFQILGTICDGDKSKKTTNIIGESCYCYYNDESRQQQQVLSPTNMESLQSFFPFSKVEDNFWLRYAMVRDGGSIQTFLEHASRSQYSILAIETIDGEVFGAFTAEPWKKDWNYFGTGESFLWRMRNRRDRENDKNNKMKRRRNFFHYHDPESELDVYPCTGENEYIQLCNHDKIVVGGGCTSEIAGEEDDCDDISDVSIFRKSNFGHGLYIGEDMRQGTSSPCVTFRSPSLSKTHSDGSLFEIANLELWTLTPCTREEDAEILERSIQLVSSQ